MELIVIDEDRIKIMISGEELASYNIDASTLDPSDGHTKRILYDIIDRARRSAGLEGARSGMFVQVFTSSDGGCEMYVTGYSHLYDEEGGAENMEETGNAGMRRRRPVYRFSCIGDLLCACRALERRGYGESSDAYITESGEIYLVLCEGDADLSVALEYGESVFFGGMMLYLSEYAAHIRERDAVEALAPLCTR